MSGFSVQKYVKFKKRSSPKTQYVFSPNENKVKKRYSPQTEVLVSHHTMMSPQNGDTWGGPPPVATPLVKRLIQRQSNVTRVRAQIRSYQKRNDLFNQ